MQNFSFVKRTLAFALLFFPILSILAFALHFHSLPSFFHFHWSRPEYNAGPLFDALVGGRGHSFVVAHFIVYLALPFLLLAVLVLGVYLLHYNQLLAIIGTTFGILGCLAMTGVVATWLSFASIAHVTPESYDGARAALIELTKIRGTLGFNTTVSYGCFIGLIILAAGLMWKKVFQGIYMALIMAGSSLFLLFMDQDNWMMIGTVMIGIGLLPVIKRLRT